MSLYYLPGWLTHGQEFGLMQTVTVTTTSHGNLAGLGADDHPQYPERTNAEMITGAWILNMPLDHDGLTVGFYAKAPVVQAAAGVNLTDNSGGAADNTIQALPDPADAPATADALRDDLVLNLIPALRNNYADLAAKVNKALTVIRDVGLMAT